MLDIPYWVIMNDDKQFFQHMNDSHIFWATEFRYAEIFASRENAVKHHKSVGEGHVVGVRVISQE
jgi:hypothetical protein